MFCSHVVLICALTWTPIVNYITRVSCFDFQFGSCAYLCCPIVILSLLDFVIYCVGGCVNMEAWNEMLLGKWTIESGNDESKDLLQLLFDVVVGPKVAR